MTRYIVALFALSTLGLVLVPSARAQSLNIQQQSAMVWREMSDCAQQAAKQYKDHTPEGNAKREAARLDCLRRNHLPITTEPHRYY